MPVVRVHREAALEAEEAAAWYEAMRPGLGHEFSAATDAAIELVQEGLVPLRPVPGDAGRLGARRVILRRFPYDVVVMERSGEWLVLAIAHHSRKPGYWKSRR